MNGRAIDEPILIRFDGLDAERHEIELGALGESLRGLSRIIGVSANFAATNRFVQHKDAFEVKVTTTAIRPRCFEIEAWVRWAANNPLISTVTGGLLVALIVYIFKRASGQREEMKHLRDALGEAIRTLGTRDKPIIERLLDTVDKMADALRPAARQAVAPIGETASQLTIGTPRVAGITLGRAEKEAILADEPTEIEPQRVYRVLITELDMETGACKLALADEPDNEDRIKGQITDPIATMTDNAYALALAGKKVIPVEAKAMLKDGKIEKLFISNIYIENY